MKDILERLRELNGESEYWRCRMSVERAEAADEIERLRSILDENDVCYRPKDFIPLCGACGKPNCKDHVYVPAHYTTLPSSDKSE